jgi:hypothetical protein
MARKARKLDPATQLAEQMLRVLEAQRSLGPASYPLTALRLGQLTDAQAPSALLKKVAAKKSFQKLVVLARGKALDAPLVLAADLDLLAASPLTLEFLLRSARTASTHAFSPSQLKQKAAGKLQKAFQAAVTRQIEQGTLAPTVGWITMGGRKMLFLLTDLHTNRTREGETRRQGDKETGRTEDVQAPKGVPSPVSLSPCLLVSLSAFDEVFQRLDRQAGGHNFVSLVELRRALPVPREEFDAELRRLRQSGRYSLSAAEGRHGISPEELQAGIPEEGSLLLFVSRSLP